MIFSDPILRDVRKLELKGPGGPAPAVAETAAGKVTRTNKKIVELDTDDRAGNENSLVSSVLLTFNINLIYQGLTVPIVTGLQRRMIPNCVTQYPVFLNSRNLKVSVSYFL